MVNEDCGQPMVGNSSREEKLAQILAECSDRLNVGEPIDSRRIVDEHPDLAPDLEVALESLRDVDSSVESERPQTVLGDFRILREVGRGGMGIIYEAWQISMDRRVALKVLPAAFLANRKALARFEQEAKVAGRLQHPNIVSVYGKGIEGGAPFYAMEFVDGETLDEILSRLRPLDTEKFTEDSGSWDLKPLESLSELFRPLDEETLPASDTSQQKSAGKSSRDRGLKSSFGAEEINLKYCLTVAEAFADVADGLQYAHQKGVIHRDLKPSNLILDRKGRLRILDFGLARLEGQERLSVSGEFLGTPLYMSPEQAMAHRVPLDYRTDIYSLGATLYEVLTRRPPFRGKDYKETLSQIISRDPPPLRRLNPRIPRSLETMVLKCLRKDPDDRYGTAEALAQDLRRFVRGDPIEARPQPALERVARRAWRHKWPILGLACAVLLCLTTGIILRDHFREARLLKNRLYSEKVIDAAVKIGLGRPIVQAPLEDPRKALPEEEPQRGLLFEVAYAMEVTGQTGWDPVEEALLDLQEAVAEFPERPDGHYHMARALLLLGRREQALSALESAIRWDQNFIPAVTLRDVLLEKPEEEKVSPGGQDSRDLAALTGWRDAWSEAHRAMVRKDWERAAEAYTALLKIEREKEEPFLGASIQALLGRGRAFLRLAFLGGKEYFGRAIGDFQAAQFQWKDLIEPDLLLGKTFHLNGHPDWAKDVFEGLYRRVSTREREPLRDEVALRVSKIYSGLREYKEGSDWAGRAGESPPRERRMASLLISLGRQEDALERAKRAVELEEKEGVREPKSYETLAFVLFEQGKLDAALSQLNEALKIDSTFFRACTLRGHVYEKLGKIEEARRDYLKAAELNPKAAWPRMNLGVLLHREGKIEDAIQEYRKALDADPEHAATHSNLGEALRRLERLDEALIHHRKAVQLDPGNARHRNNLAFALKDKRDSKGQLDAAALRDAIAELQEACKLDPENPRRYNRLGYFLAYWIGDPKRAIDQYKKAIDLHPKYWIAYYNMMLSLKSVKDRKGAILSGDKAREILSEAPEAISKSETSIYVYFHSLKNLWELTGEDGQSEKARNYSLEALSFLKSLVNQSNASPEHLNFIAYTYLHCEPPELRDPKEAIRFADRMVKAAREAGITGNPLAEYLDTLAEAHFENGDLEEAERISKEAKESLPPQPRSNYDLAVRKTIENNYDKFKAAEDKKGEKDDS